MAKNKEKKPKKEKIIYIDDGRSIADMSSVSGGNMFGKGTSSSPKDIWKTYWAATRMMVKPTLVAVGFLLVVFLIVSLLFKIM